MNDEVGQQSDALGPDEDPVLPCGLKRARRCRVRIVLRDANFRPYETFRYKLEVAGEQFSGEAGSGGVIDHVIPADAKTGKLSVWLKADSDPYVWELDLDLEPASLTKGLQARLQNLEIDPGAVDGKLSAQTKSAAATFEAIFHPPVQEPADSTSELPEPSEKMRADLDRVYRGDDGAPETGVFLPGAYRPRDAFTG